MGYVHRFLCCFAIATLAAAAADKRPLQKGWAIQSSAEVREPGEAVSSIGFSTRGWYPASVPSTVFGALVEERVYPDPYSGMNLRSAAGETYPIGANFSNVAMPPESPFRHSWWYRTEFAIPADYRGKTVWLGLDGLNFRAGIWLNGRKIASPSQVAGAWRLFEFDITAAARPGETNTLAIEVSPPDPHDLAITFVDWNPSPPDKCMGLWRDVWIAATGPTVVRYPSVTTHLDSGAAQLTVRAEVTNATDRALEGVLKGKIESVEFSQPVRLAAHETRVVHFPQLKFAHPRLWWPVQVGAQELYPLELTFEAEGQVSDSRKIEFGIREITSEVDAQVHRVFHINGKNILIRGAGYTFDMLLRSTPEHQEAELKYVRDMNLNAIRFEGKLEDENFLELCDRYGILVLAGWCCCDQWEKWNEWGAENETIAAESLRDQLRRLASHPSVADWMYGSDNPPPPKIEKMYLDIIKEVEWPNPYHSSATAKKTPLGGATGVKMEGPYEYIAPSYWELDTKRGGAHGFATEVGPGPAPPPIESLRRMLPEEHLWPIDSWWDFHSGGGAFKTIRVFTEALDKRYGKSANVEEYARKSQMMAYEGHRAMFEAYGRNKYTSTGVIQWMLNNAWPSMIWHLYDWYLRPGGSYFGAKIANEPLHVQYSYDDRSVVVVNSYYRAIPNVKVTAKVYNLDMTEKFSREATASVGEDSSTRVFTVPEIAGLSPTYFVSLTLADSAGATVSRNFYWLSTTAETLDWDKSTWYHTPTKTFADFTALNNLPPADVQVSAETRQPGATTVTVRNTGRTLAFGVHLSVKKGADGEEILPVLWEDNYFALLPGETRRIAATYSAHDLGKSAPVVEADAWNMKPARAQ
jgi:exo-1,4-beta-D-glucosaminidase